MPRRRTPLAKAKATGQDQNHASRYRKRREPKAGGPLGDPPKWMTGNHQIEAWRTLSSEIPWLTSSHRGLVGIASEILGKQMAGEELSVNALNLLRLTLGQLGATPVDSSKVSLPDGEEENEDPAAKYF